MYLVKNLVSYSFIAGGAAKGNYFMAKF